MPVRDNDGLILLTSANKIVRISVDEVRTKGRATMGVMLVRLDEGGHVVGFDRVDEGGQTGRYVNEELDEIMSDETVEGGETPAAAAPADTQPAQNDEPEDDEQQNDA